MVAHHGIYVPQGMVNAVAGAEDVRLVTWNPGYRKQTFIFSHGDSYHHTMMDEPTALWEDLDLSAGGGARIDDYLSSRRTGSQDWIWFHEKPRFDPAWIARTLGVDFSKPCIGLLTNVVLGRPAALSGQRLSRPARMAAGDHRLLRRTA